VVEERRLHDELLALRTRLEEAERGAKAREAAQAAELDARMMRLGAQQSKLEDLEARASRSNASVAELEAKLQAERREHEEALRAQAERLRKEVASDLAAAGKVTEQALEWRLADLEARHVSEKRELETQVELLTGSNRRYEEQVALFTQQLNSEKATFKEQIAKLHAAEKRNEDRILVLVQKQQEAKRQLEQQTRNTSACGC